MARLSSHGDFNGNGKVINGLHINNAGSGNPVGLFGYFNGTNIYRVGLENVSIVGNNEVGALVGHISSGYINDVIFYWKCELQ